MQHDFSRSMIRGAIVAAGIALSGCHWFHRGQPEAQSVPPSESAPAKIATPEPAETPQPAAMPASAIPAPTATATPEAPTSAESINSVQPLVDSGSANDVRSEPADSLKPTHDLNCLESSAITNEDTAADLYAAMGRCVAENNMPRAVFLAALAGTYARFDAMRVADPSAHDAGQILARRAVQEANEAQRDQLAQVSRGVSRDANVLTAVCTEIRRIGPPNYFPTYMIEHGKSGTAAETGAIWAEDFDPLSAWQQALNDYLHCPNPAPGAEPGSKRNG